MVSELLQINQHRIASFAETINNIKQLCALVLALFPQTLVTSSLIGESEIVTRGLRGGDSFLSNTNSRLLIGCLLMRLRGQSTTRLVRSESILKCDPCMPRWRSGGLSSIT